MVPPPGEDDAAAGAREGGDAPEHCARTGRPGRPKVAGQEAILPDLVAFLLARPDIKAVGKVEKVHAPCTRCARAHSMADGHRFGNASAALVAWPGSGAFRA